MKMPVMMRLAWLGLFVAFIFMLVLAGYYWKWWRWLPPTRSSRFYRLLHAAARRRAPGRFSGAVAGSAAATSGATRDGWRWTGPVYGESVACGTDGGDCPLFSFVLGMLDGPGPGLGRRSFGRVLDAGTGAHSLGWLLSVRDRTESITAVTGDPGRRMSLAEQFCDRLRPQDAVLSGNWQDAMFLDDQPPYDTVLADYLLGAIEGFAPYFQYELFDRLRPLVGKRLVVIGLEPLSLEDEEGTRDGSDGHRHRAHRQLIAETAAARDACILLAGRRPYREYPLEVCTKLLKKAGFRIVKCALFDTHYTRKFILGHLSIGFDMAGVLRDPALQDGLFEHLNELRFRIEQLDWSRVSVGHDYVVIAEPN